jgi:hypothetical protein
VEVSRHKLLKLNPRIAAAALAFAVIVILSGILFAVQRTEASPSSEHHGIVSLGTTNEGGSGAYTQPATGGILDILAGPCNGSVSNKQYESLPSIVTLSKGSMVVAQWEIYGEQRIAWVEPVGKYSIRTDQTPFTKNQFISVSASHDTKVDLLPACPGMTYIK